jgi:hypothetical protein
MDSGRNKNMVLKSQKGQTVVEYILLLVVAISLVLTFYRSAAFRKVFGDQGLLGEKIKKQGEFSYRHGFYQTGPGGGTIPDIPRENKSVIRHPSYTDVSNGGTRFFGPKDSYGQ